MKKSKSQRARSAGHGRTGVVRAEPKRRTHFVPGVVFRTAFAGVIPVCVAASSSDCGGAVKGQPAQSENCDPSIYECCNGYPCATVANVAFAGFTDAMPSGRIPFVAAVAFDGGGGPDGVALVAFADASPTFDGGDADGSDAGPDASVAPDATSDAGEQDEGSFGDAAADSSLSLGDSATDGSFGDAGLDADAPDGGDD